MTGRTRVFLHELMGWPLPADKKEAMDSARRPLQYPGSPLSDHRHQKFLWNGTGQSGLAVPNK